MFCSKVSVLLPECTIDGKGINEILFKASGTCREFIDYGKTLKFLRYCC